MEQTGQDMGVQESGQIYAHGTGRSGALPSVPSFKEGILKEQQPEENFSSPTPMKIKEPSRIKCKEASELPEKYRMLSEFFNNLTCSLRLLSLRKKLPIFTNISRQIEILAGRKFLLKHLAQIKYILPEAVQIDKILIHDEETKCMKPHVKVALKFDVIEGHQEESSFIALSNLFSSRLREFQLTHSKDFDIPEAVLPEPFNQGNMKMKVDLTSKDLLPALDEMGRFNPSHLSPSFFSHFSQKVIAEKKEKTCLLSPITSCSVVSQEIERPRTSSNSSSQATDALKVSQTSPGVSSGIFGSTPVKLSSPEGYHLVVETPAQSTPVISTSPNRLVLTCEAERKTPTTQNCTNSTLSAKRVLDFFSVGGDPTSQDLGHDVMEHPAGVCNTFSQMKREGISIEDDNIPSVTSFCKVEESSCRIDDEHDQNKNSSLKLTSSCLSDLALLIHHIFQSVGFRSITKEELIHKILLNNCDIDDHSEVVMQIEQLEKLVPDWFYKKFAPSGDLLYHVKKVSDLDTVRERISFI